MTAQADDFRDDALARALRAHGRETPPAAVDDAIRAAARRAVASRPGEGFRAWRPLAAAAAVGLIAFGIVMLASHQGDHPLVLSDATPSPSRESPADPTQLPLPAPAPERAAPRPPSIAADAASPALPSSMADAQRQAPARAVPGSPPAQARLSATPRPPAGAVTKPTDGRLAQESAREAVAAPAAPAAVQASGPGGGSRPQPTAQVAVADAAGASARAATPGSGEGTVNPAARERAEGESAIDRDTAQRAAEASEAAVWAREAPRSMAAAPARSAGALAARREQTAPAPQGSRAAPGAEPAAKAIAQFIADIRRHLAAGERDAAARELRAFRAAYADADRHLPEELQTWAAGMSR